MTHPITPPPELMQQWLVEAHSKHAPPGTCPDTRILIARAAQWGADQELEACCEWLPSGFTIDGQGLRSVRRPKPPSLAEKALEALDKCGRREHYVTDSDYWNPIINALQRLAELEQQATP